MLDKLLYWISTFAAVGAEHYSAFAAVGTEHNSAFAAVGTEHYSAFAAVGADLGLCLQENYLSYRPATAKNIVDELEAASMAADSIAESDLCMPYIRGASQNWSLLPFYGMGSTVAPAFHMRCENGQGPRRQGWDANAIKFPGAHQPPYPDLATAVQKATATAQQLQPINSPATAAQQQSSHHSPATATTAQSVAACDVVLSVQVS